MFITLLINSVINYTLYFNIASFVPLYIEEYFSSQITTLMVSLGLSAFELSSVCSSRIHAATVSKIGRKKAIIIAYSLICVCLCGIGALDMIPKDNWVLFYTLFVVLRAIQGYGDSLAITTQISIIANTFSDSKSECIGLLEAA